MGSVKMKMPPKAQRPPRNREVQFFCYYDFHPAKHPSLLESGKNGIRMQSAYVALYPLSIHLPFDALVCGSRIKWIKGIIGYVGAE